MRDQFDELSGDCHFVGSHRHFLSVAPVYDARPARTRERRRAVAQSLGGSYHRSQEREWNDGEKAQLQGDVREVRRDAAHAALLRVYRTAPARAGWPVTLVWSEGSGAHDVDPARTQVRVSA